VSGVFSEGFTTMVLPAASAALSSRCLPERVVPRRYGTNHAERLASQVERVVSDVVTPLWPTASEPRRKWRSASAIAGTHLTRRRHGLSRVGDLEIRKSLKVPFEKVSDAMQELRTLTRRKLTPRGKARAAACTASSTSSLFETLTTAICCSRWIDDVDHSSMKRSSHHRL